MVTASYSTDSEGNGVITVSAGNYSGSLIDFLNNNSWDANTQNLTIQGAGENSSTWIDFKFHYDTHGKPAALHIQNIKFLTSSVVIRIPIKSLISLKVHPLFTIFLYIE